MNPSRLVGSWAGDLVVLVLILTHRLGLAEMLVCYALETLALGFLAGVWERDRRGGDHGVGPIVRDFVESVAINSRNLGSGAAFGIIPLLMGLIAAESVHWDSGAAVTVGGCAVLQVVLVGVAFHRADPDDGPTLGSLLWRYLLLVIGALVGLQWAEDLAYLHTHGWEPAVMGHVWGSRPGYVLNSLVVRLGIAPLTASTLVFFAYKLLNQAAYAGVRAMKRSGRPQPRDRWEKSGAPGGDALAG